MFLADLARISHRLTAEARDRRAMTSLRLLAVLDGLPSTPPLVKRRAPRTDVPLTHFASPRGEKSGPKPTSLRDYTVQATYHCRGLAKAKASETKAETKAVRRPPIGRQGGIRDESLSLIRVVQSRESPEGGLVTLRRVG